MDLTISVVTYNNSDKILSLLSSIYNFTCDIKFQVYLIDNSSSDNTVSIVKNKFPEVSIIQNENLGFGHGHNRILNIIDSKYHVIINPDIILTSNIFKDLYDYMELNSHCALATPRVLNQDGTEQFLPKLTPTYKYLFLGRLSKFIKSFAKYRDEYTMKNRNFNEPCEIEFSTGCFMMMRTEIFKSIGGFDEEYFMYMEDADLSRRIRKFGKIVFYPNSSVVHAWDRKSSKNIKFLFLHFKSVFIYMRKFKKIQ